MTEPLLTPRTTPGDLVVDDAGLLAVLEQLSLGDGPIAIDAERASGYRYSQRAYLIQIFRRGGGLHLIDPISAKNPEIWAQINETFNECEWIIHASTQDLACLREIGISPRYLFDTELGARIAGCERVGLGALTESLLDLTLAKEHSAVDWSIRPLKAEWLAYAALDVDVLVDLRDQVKELLTAKNKLEWAEEDFAAILLSVKPPAKIDPWRKCSGMHKVRDRMTLAIVKALWQVRDAYASQIDVAQGRVFNDEALLEIATKRPPTIDSFTKIITRRTRAENPPVAEWFELLRTTLALPLEELPPLRLPSLGVPPQKLWKDRNPLGYARLTHARAAVLERAQELELPAENLISPEAIRVLMWPEPPEGADTEYVATLLHQGRARKWQIEALVDHLVPALSQRLPLFVPEPPALPEVPEAPAPE